MAAKTKFEVTVDKKGEFRWKLFAKNGEPVAVGGEPFKTKAAAMGAVKRIADWAKTADVEFVDPKAKKAPAKAPAKPAKKPASKKAPAKKTDTASSTN